MSQLLKLRDAIVASVKQTLQGADVQGHLGRFTEAEIQRFVMAAPAVRVAILALEDPKPVSDGGVDYCVRIGIYVVTNDRPGLSRDEAATAGVEAILKLCDRTNWKLGAMGVRVSEKAAAQNLYSDKALSSGVALWAIDLRQPIRLVADTPDAVAIKRLFLGFAPNIGTGHEADYIEIVADKAETLNVG